jgi:hypothetical protein
MSEEMVYLEEMSHKDQGRKFIVSPINVALIVLHATHSHFRHIWKLLIHIS